MEKDKMLQILIPALALAAVIVVVALIVGQSSPDSTTAPTKPGSGIVPPLMPEMKVIAEVPANTEGTSMTKPDLNAAEWRDIGAGLKIWDVKVGEVDPPITASDTGLWHYTGWLPNGNVFDSSVRKNEPFSTNLNSVVKGWMLGLPGMKVGGIRRLYIPSALAYGAKGAGRDIPANTDLIFEVKLLRISR